MQDIIPSYKTQRGQIRSNPRGRVAPRSSASYRLTTHGSIDGIVALCQPAESGVLGGKSRLRRPLAHAAVKADIVARAVAAQRYKKLASPKTTKHQPRFAVPRRSALAICAVLVLALTGYISIDTWVTNNKVKAEFLQTHQTASTATEQQAQEGHDESEPQKNTLANYKVAASLPRALYINKINISARILPMSVNGDGSVQAPRNIFDSGWYTGSVKPGETGAMFIDGHASGPTREGLFAYLDKLVEGDIITVEKGDSSRLTYKVVHVEVQPLDSLDMKKMLLPYGTVSKGLNLMTCAGKWIDSSKTFDKRVLVYAEQVS